VDQGRRPLVEELRVIDDQEQPPVLAGPLEDGVGGLPQQPEQVARRVPGRGEERRERPERDGGRRPGRDRLGRGEPEPGGRPGDLGGEPGLADADRAGQHERGGLRPPQLREDPVQLRLA
jgi:hypothetical protein